MKFGLNVFKLLGSILLIEIMKTRMRRQNFIKEKHLEKSSFIKSPQAALQAHLWLVVLPSI